MAETLGLAPGDTLEIKTDDGWRQIPVAAVAEHYLNHYVYLCQDDYEQVFGEPPAYNQLYVKTDSTDNAYEESLRAGILEMENITQVASNTATIQAFQDTVDNMMTVVIVLILSAGLLAFVVLYNLTNINIGERVREIATLKVLGFAVARDGFAKHGQRPYPKAAFAIQRAVNHIRLLRFAVQSHPQHLVFAALKMAVFSHLQHTDSPCCFLRGICIAARSLLL